MQYAAVFSPIPGTRLTFAQYLPRTNKGLAKFIIDISQASAESPIAGAYRRPGTRAWLYGRPVMAEDYIIHNTTTDAFRPLAPEAFHFLFDHLLEPNPSDVQAEPPIPLPDLIATMEYVKKLYANPKESAL